MAKEGIFMGGSCDDLIKMPKKKERLCNNGCGRKFWSVANHTCPTCKAAQHRIREEMESGGNYDNWIYVG
jgi:hypothetical protein